MRHSHRTDAIRLSIVACLALFASCTAAHAPPEEVDRVIEALRASEGSRLADVGAGDGEFAEVLADHVGETGHVWATEIDEEDVADLSRYLDAEQTDNITVLLGHEDATGLPDACCDAILLRQVYHHFTDPAAMMKSLARSLRPGGRLVVIEIDLQKHWDDLEGVPDRGGHGIAPEDLERELKRAGWSIVERHDDWPGGERDRYCRVVTPPPG